MPPGKNMDDWCTMLWSGMIALNWKLSKEGRKRLFNEFIPLLHDTKTEVLGKDNENSWYLVYIGTKTASRGRGYAKALIEHTTKQVSRHLFFSPKAGEQYVGTLAYRKIRPILKTAPATSNVATRSTSSSTRDSDLTSSRRSISIKANSQWSWIS